MKILHIPSGQFIKLYAEGAQDEDGPLTEIIEEACLVKNFLKTHTKKQLLELIFNEFENSSSYASYRAVKQANGLDPDKKYSRIEFQVYWRKDYVS